MAISFARFDPTRNFSVGVLKNKVYSAKSGNIVEFKEQIRPAIAQVPLEQFVKVCCSVPVRLAKCIELHGEQTEL